MKVVCAWTDLDARARAALDRYAPGWESEYVGMADTAYAEAVEAHWLAGEDFILVEHDIEIHADVIPTFEACPGWWCVYRYQNGHTAQGQSVWLDNGLGCVRFRAELMRAAPRALEGAHHWSKVSSDLYRGFRLPFTISSPHVHLPPVTHHHPR